MLNQLMVNHDKASHGFVLPNPKKLGAIRGIYSGGQGCVLGMNTCGQAHASRRACLAFSVEWLGQSLSVPVATAESQGVDAQW